MEWFGETTDKEIEVLENLLTFEGLDHFYFINGISPLIFYHY